MRNVKFLLAAIVFLIFGNSLYAQETLRLATTTSAYETGLLDYIFPPFEKKHNVKIHIISAGTGKAIKLGENGDVDIILVHDRDSEDKFISDGFGVNRRDVMYNDFLILGPKDDPAKISGLTDAVETFKKIAQAKAVFISRGDESGTHKKEKYLWSKIGITPKDSWYLEAGQGISATSTMADEKNGYVLVDRAIYLFHKDKIRLVIMVEKDKVLFNPYGVIAVNPYTHAHIKYELAMEMIAWLTSPQCQKMIGEYKKDGNIMYYPNAANPISAQ